MIAAQQLWCIENKGEGGGDQNSLLPRRSPPGALEANASERSAYNYGPLAIVQGVTSRFGELYMMGVNGT